MGLETDFLTPQKSAVFIADNSEDVVINKEGIERMANIFIDGMKNGYRAGSWSDVALYPKDCTDDTVEWIFFVDTLNFSFWTNHQDDWYQVTLNGHTYSGFMSLCAVVNRALQEGIPLTSSVYYSSITKPEFDRIFRSDSGVSIPLADKRLQILHETGHTLNDKFGGKFVNCLRQCQGSINKLISLVFNNFPSYRDVVIFKGHKVSFLKRLQILIADLWLAFGGQGHGKFDDIDSITAFADYRIPQVLSYYGALTYSKDLQNLLKSNQLLEPGGSNEVQIRGCTIRAVELISKKAKHIFEQHGQINPCHCNMILVDNFIWDLRRKEAYKMESVPFHRVRSIFY